MDTTNVFYLDFLSCEDKLRLLTVSRTTTDLLNDVPHVFQHVSIARSRYEKEDGVRDVNLRNIWERAGDQLRTIHLQGLSNVTEFGFIMLQPQPHLIELSIVDCDFNAIDRLKIRTMDREFSCAGAEPRPGWEQPWCPSCTSPCSACYCLTVAKHEAGAIGPIERVFMDHLYGRTAMNLNRYKFLARNYTQECVDDEIPIVPCTLTKIIDNLFAFPHPKLKQIRLEGCTGVTIEHLSMLEGHGINSFDVYECSSCLEVTDIDCSCPYKCCQPSTDAICVECREGEIEICRCDKFACETAMEVQNWDVCDKCGQVACEDCNDDFCECSRCNERVCGECRDHECVSINQSMCTDCGRWFCCVPDENEEDFTIEHCTNCDQDYCGQCRESSAMCSSEGGCMAITCGNCEPSTIFRECDECGGYYCKGSNSFNVCGEDGCECDCSEIPKRKRKRKRKSEKKSTSKEKKTKAKSGGERK